MSDLTGVIYHEAACRFVERAFDELKKMGFEPDQRSILAIEYKRKWMRREISSSELNNLRNQCLFDTKRAFDTEIKYAVYWASDIGDDPAKALRRTSRCCLSAMSDRLWFITKDDERALWLRRWKWDTELIEHREILKELFVAAKKVCNKAAHEIGVPGFNDAAGTVQSQPTRAK